MKKCHSARLNLNDLEWIDGVKQEDYSISSGNIEVYFKNLESALLKNVEEASCIVGCVAWLTLGSILDALARKNAVSLLVQKEDWLRLDFDAKNSSIGSKKVLREKISKLPKNESEWFDVENRLGYAEYCVKKINGVPEYSRDIIIDPVRCVGNSCKESNIAHPRMHHKFIVFCRTIEHISYTKSGMRSIAQPYAVWTGSFNVTSNATRSFENAVIIRDEVIADAYMKEWAQLMAFSEPLDWNVEDPNGDICFDGYWVN